MYSNVCLHFWPSERIEKSDSSSREREKSRRGKRTSQVVVALCHLRLDVDALGESGVAEGLVNEDGLFVEAELHVAVRQEELLHPVLRNEAAHAVELKYAGFEQ